LVDKKAVSSNFDGSVRHASFSKFPMIHKILRWMNIFGWTSSKQIELHCSGHIWMRSV